MSTRDKVHIERIKSELAFIRKSLLNKDKEIFLQDDVIQHAAASVPVQVPEGMDVPIDVVFQDEKE